MFRIANVFSYIIYHTKNQLSTLTHKNIKLCFPDLPLEQQIKQEKESLLHTSCTFFELAALWNHPVDKILACIKTRQVDKIFFDQHKAKIIIAPHHGSWEMLNLWLANEGPLYSLYKPAKSIGLDQYVLRKRTRNNAILVPANTTGLRRLLQGLKTGANCMILPDQRPAHHTAQIKASFYNSPAPTSLLIKRLSSKIDCNIFIASITRDLSSANYHLNITSLDRTEFLKDDLHSADYLNKSIEELVSHDVSQYQWAYRRFPSKTYKTGKI